MISALITKERPKHDCTNLSSDWGWWINDFPPVPDSCLILQIIKKPGRRKERLYFEELLLSLLERRQKEETKRQEDEKRRVVEVVQRKTQVRTQGDCRGYLLGGNVLLSITQQSWRKCVPRCRLPGEPSLSATRYNLSLPTSSKTAGEKHGENPRQPEVDAALFRSERCFQMEQWSRTGAGWEHRDTAVATATCCWAPSLLLSTSHVSSLGVFQRQQTEESIASGSLEYIHLYFWTTDPSKKRQQVIIDLWRWSSSPVSQNPSSFQTR